MLPSRRFSVPISVALFLLGPPPPSTSFLEGAEAFATWSASSRRRFGLGFHGSPPPSSFRSSRGGGGGGSSTTTASSSTTSLRMAIGVLARKAKETDVRKYVENGVEESVLSELERLKEGLASLPSSSSEEIGPLQRALTKRKGTVSIIAEYKRKLEGAPSTTLNDEIFDPAHLGPTFREFGASAIAVLADERTGGCTYDDVREFVDEQRSAKGNVPGPLGVISSDWIVDEVQIARASAAGAAGVVVVPSVVGEERSKEFVTAAKVLGMESIVSVSTEEEADGAVSELGATLILINGIDAEDKAAILDSLSFPDDVEVCTIANVLARNDESLQEVEEAWTCRDRGFNAVWVSDALYKGGTDEIEHPGAIIRSMAAKSSVRWASPKARGGKGEGSREYLGDILM